MTRPDGRPAGGSGRATPAPDGASPTGAPHTGATPRDGVSLRGTALVREPSPRLADGIVTHLTRSPVDVDLARDQHRRYVEALAAHGWQPVPVGDGDPHPDGVFVEDTAVVVGDLAVLTRPGAPTRRAEVAAVRAALTRLGVATVDLAGPGSPDTPGAPDRPGTLDGGDVLQVGDTVYVGRGDRTDAAGIRRLRSLLEPAGRRVVPVSTRGTLHLKSAVTALPDGTLLGLTELLDADGLPSMRRPPEPEGAHVVPLGDGGVLLAASAPRTAQWLDDLGFAVTVVDVGEFEKLEGCVTCLSVLLPGVAAGEAAA